MALGTMTWGRDTDEPEARSQYKAFIEAGGNFLDTADTYAKGVLDAVKNINVEINRAIIGLSVLDQKKNR